MKWAILGILIGWGLIRADVENIVTGVIPGNYEIIIGIIILVYSFYRLHKKKWN